MSLSSKFDNIVKKKNSQSSSSLDDDCDGCIGLKALTREMAAKKRNQNANSSSNNVDSNLTSSENASTSVVEDQSSWPVRKAPDIVELGNGTWTLLHTMAAYYPDRPNVEQQEQTVEFIHSLSNVFPCSWCASDFRTSLRARPPQVDSRQAFALWLCHAHNEVNEKLGKPSFDCSLEALDRRWRAPRWK